MTEAEDIKRRRGRRVSSCAIYALLLILASVAPAYALIHFSFEGPYLFTPGQTIKDHALVQIDGEWHCIFIHASTTAGSSGENELGHARSEDLRQWEFLPAALVSGPQSWDARNVWAPQILPQFPLNSAYALMIYTGADAQVVQRTGYALTTSRDLLNWQKNGSNPVLQPDSTLYSWAPSQSFSSFRDPFYFYYAGQHHLLHTAQLRTVNGDRGCIHHAVSDNFVSWIELDPLLVHNGNPTDRWRDLESVQLYQDGGQWHLFYSEFDKVGVYHLRNGSLLSGWDMTQAELIDQGQAPELVPLGGGKYLFSRYTADTVAFDGEELWVVRVDTLSFDPNTGSATTVPFDVLAADWPQRSGIAFEAAPTFGDNSAYRGETPASPVGHGYVCSAEYYQGPLSGKGVPGQSLPESTTGSMKSRPFVIEGIRLDLRVGGGTDPNCFVALMDAVADTALFRAYGHGGPELLPVSFDLAGLAGRSAYIWIEDASTAPGGYIAVDEIREIGDPTSSPIARRRGRGELLPNQPNPFNPRTVLRWRQDEYALAELWILDPRGRVVCKLSASVAEPGTHERLWGGDDDEGRAVASGVYRVLLRLGGQPADSRAITLIR
jgi:hypothetical protein